MPPDSSSPASSIRSPTSAGKSLLAKGLTKVTSPFATKSRNYTDYYIELDEPHRQYSPGDGVKGSVLLTVIKAIRITHIVVCLHGYVQVFRNPSSPGSVRERDYLEPANGKRKSQYFGNGFAALFKDEVVLCGEGRLGEGIYRFNFELLFPRHGLPSSIDFERGTISYMVTSTLTRPTAIAPTATCERKVYLIEDIDVAPLKIPKPRVVSLEAVSRRYKVRSTIKRTKGVEEDPKRLETTTSRSSHHAQARDADMSANGNDSPRSPEPSENSFDGAVSSSAMASAPDSPAASVFTAGSGVMNPTNAALPPDTITAKIELMKAGYLRGDTITVLLTVNHIKPIRSMHGIVTTLYRQARVDMRPALPISEAGKGDKPKYEDYYAKSKTGLGGLSLSDAGSSHVFRKDISQSFTPLLVDPRTLMVEVKAAVRVPDEAFPTISTVPGAMISFKYYVEVVVDLQGKLAALDSFLPSVGMAKMSSGFNLSSGDQGLEDAGPNILAAWGRGMVNTDQIRRDKNVISQLFEITVGTKDTSRRRGKQKDVSAQGQTPCPRDSNDAECDGAHNGEGLTNGFGEDRSNGQNAAANTLYQEQIQPRAQQADDLYGPPTPDQPPSIPLPDMSAEDDLDEKTRARRAEERLYPSQPPIDEAQQDSLAPVHEPSAPLLSDDMHVHYDQGSAYAGPSSARDAMTTPRPVHNEMDLLAVTEASALPAPAYQDAVGSSGPAATEDKQELQRRRLQMEASAPLAPEDEDMGNEQNRPNAGPSAPVEATVPTMSNEDIDDVHDSQHDSHAEAFPHPRESLPQYQR